MKVEQVAMVAHEANRAYCESIGDTSQRPWDEAPQWQRDSAVKGVIFHVDALAKGRKKSPSESHEAWLAHKRATGWKYGPVKNEESKEHPCFVPYEALPIEQRAKDYLFSAIVEALVSSLDTQPLHKTA